MGNEAQHHRKTVGLDRARHFKFVFERVGACDPVVELAGTRLKADLNMIESGLFQASDTLAGHADTRGYQVCVEAEFSRLGDDHFQIFANDGLAAGQAELCSAQFTGFSQDANPVISIEFDAGC